MRSWSLFTPLLLVELTTVAPYLLAFPLGFCGDWIEFYARLLVLLEDFLSSLLSLLTYVICCTGCLSQRISYRTAAVVSRCVLGCAPSYLRDLCRPVSDVVARRALRSTTRGELIVPRARLAIKQRRAFSVVGPSIWNDLPLKLRSLLVSHPAGFYKSLQSFFFSRGWAGSASE